jgi:hypothetical protein
MEIAYNSCRNGYCPKCQGAAVKELIADREAASLPLPYDHAVFALPAPIADNACQNKAALYDLLCKVGRDHADDRRLARSTPRCWRPAEVRPLRSPGPASSEIGPLGLNTGTRWFRRQARPVRPSFSAASRTRPCGSFVACKRRCFASSGGEAYACALFDRSLAISADLRSIPHSSLRCSIYAIAAIRTRVGGDRLCVAHAAVSSPGGKYLACLRTVDVAKMSGVFMGLPRHRVMTNIIHRLESPSVRQTTNVAQRPITTKKT